MESPGKIIRSLEHRLALLREGYELEYPEPYDDWRLREQALFFDCDPWEKFHLICYGSSGDLLKTLALADQLDSLAGQEVVLFSELADQLKFGHLNLFVPHFNDYRRHHDDSQTSGSVGVEINMQITFKGVFCPLDKQLNYYFVPLPNWVETLTFSRRMGIRPRRLASGGVTVTRPLEYNDEPVFSLDNNLLIPDKNKLVIGTAAFEEFCKNSFGV
ncbi:MAG TPA: hypothetical protein VGA08_00085 [Candidatus Saccharimonadales bacterium]